MPSPEHHRRRRWPAAPRAPPSASSATRSPLYNPPIRVAEEFAMLDCISGGRLIAGFPVGTPMDTNFCYGQIPALTRDKYAEAHELIMRAWTSEEPFAFDGKYNQLRYVNCWPKPIQKPHPPIYIPGGGSIETWDFCLDHDYNYSLPVLLRIQGRQGAARRLLGARRRAAARTSRPYRAASPRSSASPTPTPRPRSSTPSTSSTSSTAACTSTPASPIRPATARSTRIKAGELSQLREETHGAVPDTSPGRTSSTSGFVIAGSPETVRRADGGDGQGRCASAPCSACSTWATCRTGRRATRPSCSPRRSCRSCATCGRSDATTAAGGATPLRRPARRERRGELANARRAPEVPATERSRGEAGAI